ncbi:glycoside hydrolase family 18, partial [Micromonospora sp. 15K316]|uniref:carbohydrate-binding protein n=1 Tax=Micromonospora sp. 15K316 TaxID=2530376 RepID=UPI0010D727D0
MRLRRRVPALLAGAALVAAIAALPASNGFATTQTAAAACAAPQWAEGVTYQAGSRVTYASRTYQALATHTPPPGAGWNPAATPALWSDLGACDGNPSPPPTVPPTP